MTVSGGAAAAMVRIGTDQATRVPRNDAIALVRSSRAFFSPSSFA